MSKLKVLVSNGFREHRMEVTLDLIGVLHESFARMANAFVSEIAYEDDFIDDIVTAQDIAMATASGRCYFYVDDWLVDIYVL